MKWCGSVLGESGKEELEECIDVFPSDCTPIDLGAIIRVRETDVDWLIQE